MIINGKYLLFNQFILLFLRFDNLLNRTMWYVTYNAILFNNKIFFFNTNRIAGSILPYLIQNPISLLR
ncbi:hypothetical protein C5469_01520 [Photorhabdus cinerea]|uniref:Uncharacterized protein n=1 Tax=Photorhabdus cinerea TaxID=471575 RepID=A0A7X5QAP6_9GAMM|nr:hypothetical protein [Photorhabdus cinerea]